MLEKTFYTICEKIKGAELPTGLGTYYPTVEELKESMAGRDAEEFLPILLYYATDPFKDTVEDETYRETVKYAKKLSSSIELE